MGKPQHGDHHAQQPAMEGHAALPHGKNLQRVAQVVARLVEQAVAQTAADDHTRHSQKEDVFDILARPGAGPCDGGKGRVPQTPDAQQHEQAKGRKIGQAIPVHSQRADLQGDGVDVGIGQHGGGYCARAGDDPAVRA